MKPKKLSHAELRKEILRLKRLKKNGPTYKKVLGVIALGLSSRQFIALNLTYERGLKSIDEPVFETEWQGLVDLGLVSRTGYNGEFKYIVVTELGFEVIQNHHNTPVPDWFRKGLEKCFS